MEKRPNCIEKLLLLMLFLLPLFSNANMLISAVASE